MKKTLISLLIIASLSAFILKVSSKPVPNIELNIKTLNGEIVGNGTTDNKGNFTIKLKEKGNYALGISSDEIIKGLSNFHKGKKDEHSYLVTLVVEAESNSWNVDTEHHITHTHKVKENSSIEIMQGVTITNTNQIRGWTKSMINIVSIGSGQIKGSVTYTRVK